MDVTSIGVVIPFYQRDAATLARALASIAAQDVDAAISVVVVDDASPTPAEAGLGDLAQTRLDGAVRVVKRENGGPGAARNTGLEALAGQVDAIALLDSDDIWEPGHLRSAKAALERGADVFFADYQDLEGDASHLTAMPEHEALLATARPDTPEEPTRLAEGGVESAFAHLAATTYLAHTSTIVFRAARFPGVRFLEGAPAGEDHIFFVDLALAARRLAFSLTPSMRRGRGVNIYASAQEWGSEADFLRRSYNLAKAKTILRRTRWPGPTRAELASTIWSERRTIAWLLLRQALHDRAPPTAALRSALDVDAASVLLAPFLAAAFLADRGAARSHPRNAAP